MEWTPVPFGSPTAAYDAQARDQLAALQSGQPQAIEWFRQQHPRFRRSDVPWLPRRVDDTEVQAAGFGLEEARLAVARAHDFADWPNLVAHVEAVLDPSSPVGRFERAVEAVIDGDLPALERAVRDEPGLVRERSTRVTPFDPPVHRATLLHYVAANGVEGYRQRTPSNAVAIAQVILEAGADPDALADMYGGRCTTMSMLVSSTPPARAGVQVALVDLLVDHGASTEPGGSGAWTSPLMTALTFGYLEAALALARRGARVDTLAAAAGLGDVEEVRRRLPTADAGDRHRALAMAANLGQVEVLQRLLDAGEDPDRYNPPQSHAHATPLHSAIASGHFDAVRLLVERGARVDLRDTIYDATPLEWAEYLKQTEIAAYLRGRG